MLVDQAAPGAGQRVVDLDLEGGSGAFDLRAAQRVQQAAVGTDQDILELKVKEAA